MGYMPVLQPLTCMPSLTLPSMLHAQGCGVPEELLERVFKYVAPPTDGSFQFEFMREWPTHACMLHMSSNTPAASAARDLRMMAATLHAWLGQSQP